MLLVNNDSRLHSFAFYEKNGEKVVKTKKLYFLPGKKTEVSEEMKDLLEKHPKFQSQMKSRVFAWEDKAEKVEEKEVSSESLADLPEILPADFFSTRKKRKKN
jgi:hypothetical protein